MSDWTAGYVLGIVLGIAAGYAFGSFSEKRLPKRQKKIVRGIALSLVILGVLSLFILIIGGSYR